MKNLFFVLGAGAFAVLNVVFLSACSVEKNQSRAAQPYTVEETPSVYMQVRSGGAIASVFSDMYLSRTLGGVGSGMPIIRELTKNLSNGTLVLRVNVRGGTFANQVVWINAEDVEPRNSAAAAAYRNEAEDLLIQARQAGRDAANWESAANAARFLCITGVGAGAALGVVTMGASIVGKTAFVALIGANSIRPLLDCAGINYNNWGL